MSGSNFETQCVLPLTVTWAVFYLAYYCLPCMWLAILTCLQACIWPTFYIQRREIPTICPTSLLTS